MSSCLDPFQQHGHLKGTGGKQGQVPGPISGICSELFCMDESFRGKNKSWYKKSQTELKRRYGRGGKQIGE